MGKKFLSKASKQYNQDNRPERCAMRCSRKATFSEQCEEKTRAKNDFKQIHQRRRHALRLKKDAAAREFKDEERHAWRTTLTPRSGDDAEQSHPNRTGQSPPHALVSTGARHGVRRNGKQERAALLPRLHAEINFNS